MNTSPNFTTTQASCTAAIARALLADGWTHGLDDRTEPAQGGEIRHLESLDGTLRLLAHDVSDGRCFAVLTAATVRTDGKRRRSWQARLEAAPASVALTVISAARQAGTSSDPGGIEPHLAAAGWHERPDDLDEDLEDEFDDYDEDGPLIRTWAAPDGARSVTWYGPDDDPGFWSVDRPRAEGGGISARLTEHAPAPVIAAVALAD
jgi:hypothetical protein